MGRGIRHGLVISALGLAAGCGKKAEEQPKVAVSDVVASAPSDAGVAAPSDAGVAAPSDAGVAAPSDAGAAAPSDAGAAAPSDAGLAAPSAAGASADASAAGASDVSAAGASADASAAVADAGEAKGSLEATCAAITRLSDAAFAKVEAQKKAADGKADKDWPDIIPRQGIGACVKGAGGAYAIEVSDGSYHVGSGEAPAGSSEMNAKLVFVDAQGARTELAFDPMEDHEGANFGIGVAFGQWWSVEAVHDWNNDGTAEVALRREHRSPEEQGSWIHLYRLGVDEGGSAKRLERWLPLGDTTVEKVGDEDGDGRLDLFSYHTFSRYLSLGVDVASHPEGVYFFHHALADGTFESGGDAAKAYYRKVCGDKKVEVADIPTGEGATVGAVLAKATCARLHGAKVTALRKRTDPFFKKALGADELDPSEAWLAEPPVQLGE